MKPKPRRARHVALLRGINVGGKNKLPMAELKAIFADAGCSDVTTYIQSGNVIFDAGPSVAKGLAARVSAAIEDRHGLRLPVVLRTAAELEQAWRDNPFLRAGADLAILHLMFLAEVPTPERAAELDPDPSSPDQLALVGRDLYLSCPKGMARTKLTNDYVDRTLGTTSTVRNWRTVTKLVELSRPQ